MNLWRRFIKLKRRKKILLWAVLGFLIWFAQCLPDEYLKNDTSTVLYDTNGKLLGATTSGDGQWRFEAPDSIPYKFEVCLLAFEDRNFYSHPGVSVRGIGRALVQNIKKGRVVSGGSTLTMQIARIIRGNQSRNIRSKIIEIFMALRLELRHDKKELLKIYSAGAPFGNNVVGLTAASWRYFGRSPHQLSWSESATLAVLPNAPGLIYPGKNHDRLLQKRNRLLSYLKSQNVLDEQTFSLSCQEPLPDKPLPLPQNAYHLLMKSIQSGLKGTAVYSSVDANLQNTLTQKLEHGMGWLRDNKIYNSAVLVTSVKDGSVMAYIGNTANKKISSHAGYVDCIQAPRSTGSTLKPLLYAKAMEDGLINPGTILYDFPTHYAGFSPKNFLSSYDGCVPANQALIRSLNIPFVRLLKSYGYEKFHDDLMEMNMKGINKPASHYGLTLILGGAEVSLWDLSSAYLALAQSQFKQQSHLHFLKQDTTEKPGFKFDRAASFSTLSAMSELNRPDEEGLWRSFEGSTKIAWKTGTSFGFRDAWAVGVTPEYMVSVWVGNADGEGRPGLTGIQSAAPLMFDVFKSLRTKEKWFTEPLAEMQKIHVCSVTGFRAGKFCDKQETQNVPRSCLKTRVCPHHKKIFLDKSGKFQVNANGYDMHEARTSNRLILLPAVEKYYKLNHPEYKELPPIHPQCESGTQSNMLNILYPRNQSILFIPKGIDGTKQQLIFEALHHRSTESLFWHIDNQFVAETNEIHQIQVQPSKGEHLLTVVDTEGNRKTVKFTISDDKR